MPEKTENSMSVIEGSNRESESATTLKNMRFRRGRAAKACEVCHARKVRCDMTENFPCTNCKAFSLVCTPREGRMKGSARRADGPANETLVKTSPAPHGVSTASAGAENQTRPRSSSVNASWNASVTPNSQSGESHGTNGLSGHDALGDLPPEVSSSVSRGATKHNPRTVMFMGATSHAVLQDNDNGLRKRASEDPIMRRIFKKSMDRDLFPYTDAKDQMLRSQGAFLLPSPELSDHLVDHFFKYAHPMIPVINRMEFMRLYTRDRDSPPLLLRHAIFCVGARTSLHPLVRDAKGSTRRVALTFYQRAKALYDSEYEKDSDVMMRAAVLMGLAIDHPFSVTQNAFYWTRVAITLAQGAGLHRKRSYSGDSPLEPELVEEERRQRRVWWTLYVRDVQTSMSYGRPVMINLEDCNIDMVSMEDFEGAEAEKLEPGTEDAARVLCFIQSVRLFEISALIMRVQYSVGAERLHRLHLLPDVTQCDGALAEWVNQLPSELAYSIRDSSKHEFVRSILYLQYYTVVCLAHRPQVSRLFRTSSGDIGQSRYPSWGIAFQAAHMISRIFDNLRLFEELQFMPATTVYTAFLAMMMLAYQRHSNRPAVVEAARDALTSLINSVKILARTHETASWIVVLGEELLHDDRVAHRLARTLWPKRQRDTSEEEESSLGKTQKIVKGEYDTNVGQANVLHLATRTEEPMETGAGLFPGVSSGTLAGHTEDFADESHHVSSGDESSLPDTLNMVDWYDFLMTVPNMETGMNQGLDAGLDSNLESAGETGASIGMESGSRPGMDPANDATIENGFESDFL